MVIWHLLRALLNAVFRDRAGLAAENLALRHQLVVLRSSVPRPALRDTDRAFWVALVHLSEGWSDALHIVRPATVLSWHRAHGAGRALCPKLRDDVAAAATDRNEPVPFEDAADLASRQDAKPNHAVLRTS